MDVLDQQQAWDLDTDEIRSIDSDELHDTRPNRWRGAPSTWREFTEEERLLHNSLEQTRNQDLAVHLYNAHALKRQSDPSRPPTGPAAAAQLQPPASSQLALEDLVSPGQWRPPTRWTAWPLPLSRVPDEELLRETHDDYDDFTTRRRETEMPSHKLEEEVSASILRIAKEKFLARNLRPDGDERGDVISVEAAEDDAAQSEDASEREDSPIIVKRDPSHVPNHESEEETADEEQASEIQIPGTTPDDEVEEEEGYIPVVSANDDLSYDLLRPSVRHILSQLDATLNTLHHARAAGLMTFEKRHDSDSDGSSVASDVRGRSKTPKGKGKGKGKARASQAHEEDSDADMSAEEAADEESAEGGETEAPSKKVSQANKATETPKSRPQRRRSSKFHRDERIGRWGLRDWRDVLGAAAISGFDKDVVARAAQRCADLFGQSMEFHTMTEDKATLDTVLCQPGGELPAAADADISDSERHLDEERRRKRLQAAMDRRTRERRKRRLHRQSAAATAASDDEAFKTADEEPSQLPATSDNDMAVDEDPPASVDWSLIHASPAGLYHCPIPHCRRHDKGFPAKRGLREHYRLTHGQPSGSARAFYCPFVRCTYYKLSFKTKKNLRAHLRTQHAGQVPAGAGEAMDVDGGRAAAAPAAPVIEAPASEDEMLGGVHVDGFLKPIKIRPGWLIKGGREKGQLNKKTRAQGSGKA